MMNAIQQISLKLQLGIEPSTNINAKILRDMWLEKAAGKYGPARKAGAKLCARQQTSNYSRF
jgi:hypothetical protein